MNQKTCDILNNNNHGRMEKYKSIITYELEPLETFTNNYIKKKDSNYYIEKLCELMCDVSITEENEMRIHKLFYRLFRIQRPNGYMIKHLPAVMKILEFLSLKSRDNSEYKKHFIIMLDHCIYPPLLEKSSDYLSCFNILVQYFTLLGCLLVLVSNNDEISKILYAIRQLLSITSNPIEINAIKFEYLYKAVEKSKLPLILTHLIQTSPSNILKDILHTTFTVTAISHVCCHEMLHAGIFNYILSRFANLISIKTLNDDLLKTNNYDVIIILTDILWILIKSILSSVTSPSYLTNIPPLDNNIMRSLRNIFQYAILNSKSNKKLLRIRNDLAGIILGGIVALPLWHLVNCGIGEDIIASAIDIIESNDISTINNDDIIFMKILLSIICYFSNSGGLISIMREYNIIEKIIYHLNNDMMEVKDCQFSYLMSFKLQTLAIIATKMPDDFVKYRGTTKLLSIFNCCMTIEYINSHNTMIIVKAICTIVTCKSSLILDDFRDANAITIIYKFIEQTSMIKQFFTHYQRILTLLIIIIECIMINEVKLIEIHQDQTINIIIKIMERCRNSKINNIPIDERLLIAIGSYIGECIVWYPAIIKKFIHANGIYIMLDMIENTSLFVRNVYFKALIDMCENDQCIVFLCTWRGSDKRKGFMSLLGRSWREEELIYNVKRTREGCIEDVELPLMGQAQWYTNFQSRNNHDFSPTISSMIGSIRPKIYSIRKILLANSKLCEKSREYHKIFHQDLSIDDAITLCIIDQFFRFIQGQVWIEVLNYLEQVGVNPLGIDGELLLVMSQRHRRCAIYVQERQEKILKDTKRKELIKEREEFIKIRNSTLPSALTALKEMDYIRRTADVAYRLKKKNQQKYQINNALCFPMDANIKHCHRTFNENWNVTPIINHHHYILTSIISDSEKEHNKLPPISQSKISHINLND